MYDKTHTWCLQLLSCIVLASNTTPTLRSTALRKILVTEPERSEALACLEKTRQDKQWEETRNPEDERLLFGCMTLRVRSHSLQLIFVI